jgi:tetratricopeptide (TPR) repeat protein
MARDQHGLAISTTTDEGARAFDTAISAFLKYRVDLPHKVKALTQADPDFAFGHCLSGALAMLSYKQANVAAAAKALEAARAAEHHANPRERAHIKALDLWVGGRMDRALDVWDQIIAEYPTDILAFRLAHFGHFWSGQPQAMRASVDQALPHWTAELPAYGTMLSCKCFAYEECGDYGPAEQAGLAALEIDRGDFWGAHGVAHVMEMQGRHREGIDLLKRLEPHWEGGSNIVHHLWWHRSMFHLERREFDAVLDLYDNKFRNLGSALTTAQPDVYIDVQNAASMLFRLELNGVDVGDRWIEIADKAEARIGDCLSAFTLPHWMMALAATDRDEAANRMLDLMRGYGNADSAPDAIVRTIAAPVSEAVLAHRKRDYARAVDLVRPVLDDMVRLGGSHAQQDVLEQMFLSAALKAQRLDDVRLLIDRVRLRHPVAPEHRIGYAEGARRLNS